MKKPYLPVQNADKNSQDTSWEGVSHWYDQLLSSEDTYQNKVLLPHIVRLLDPIKNKKILDIACGQGYFSFALAEQGAEMVGIDASPTLVKIANERAAEHATTSKEKDHAKNIPQIAPVFEIRKADDLHGIESDSFDAALIVLAIQNIKNVGGVFSEAKRILKKEGSMIMILNHPSFRIPQHSDWLYKEHRQSSPKGMITTGVQSRIVDTYISEKEIEIVMNPGAPKAEQKITPSFHRPLQFYTKLLAKHGFGISRLEEWNSHKESEEGPRKEAEDKARKEIPMFMMIEVKKW